MRGRALGKPATAKIARTGKISSDFCFLRWICRVLRDRQIQSQGFDLATNFAAGKISLLAGFLDALPDALPFFGNENGPASHALRR